MTVIIVTIIIIITINIIITIIIIVMVYTAEVFKMKRILFSESSYFDLSTKNFKTRKFSAFQFKFMRYI